MKHLLTATLIATALASPARGEDVTIQCFVEDSQFEFPPWIINRETMTWKSQLSVEYPALYGSSPILFWTDRAIGWASTGLYVDAPLYGVVINRENNTAQIAVIHETEIISIQAQCIRPL